MNIDDLSLCAVAGVAQRSPRNVASGQARQPAVAPAYFNSPSESLTMSDAQFPKPLPSDSEVPDGFEPGVPPVEPDEGPVPSFVPDDPLSVSPGTKPAGGRQMAIPPCGAKAPLSDAGLRLPHERDESTDAIAEAPDPLMVQAKRDIDAGLVDTDMRATPGLDAKLRARLVPGPGGKPPPSGG